MVLMFVSCQDKISLKKKLVIFVGFILFMDLSTSFMGSLWVEGKKILVLLLGGCPLNTICNYVFYLLYIGFKRLYLVWLAWLTLHNLWQRC